MSEKNFKSPLYIRTIIAAALFTFIAILLCFRLWKLQITDAEKYKKGAFEQYTTEISISPNRGTIYDRNMTPLALSVTVETVFISPYDIANQNENKSEDKKVDIYAQKEKIASFLSEKLDVDKNTILSKMEKTKSKYQIIKKKVDRDVCDEIRKFINENNIVGINLEEDKKRFYPYGSLASHVIGFTNSDNQGIYGVESYYEKYLKGSSGKIITAQNAKGNDMPFKYESYIEAENGTSVVLTIDWEIQSILEKNLEVALKDNKAQNRVFGIVMDVNTGEILAMSTKPDYDLNNPYELDEISENKYESFEGTEEEKSAYRKELLEGLWKNKAITEIYEPGSTFKLITSAMALEENVVSEADTFYCSGSKVVGGYTISCHKVGGHGIETFEEGLQNSCNPVFMELAERVGNERFYKYFEAYGFMDKTGIDLAGEVSSLYHPFAEFNQTELAVYSFGQTFKITPMQEICGVSAVANGGSLLKPHVVKALVDDDGNIIKSFDTQVVRKVNSEKTSKTIMKYLMEGINVGSTKNAYVKGYKIAAKTGTSQKRDIKDRNLYIGSCVAFAPADDPQIAIIIGIDEPSAGDYYGGVIAAPVVSSVLTEVLPYLNIEPSYNEGEAATVEEAVPDFRGYSVSGAKELASNTGFSTKVIGNGETVTEQLPRYGGKIPSGGLVILYTGNEVPKENVYVPNVINYSPSQANKTLINAGLNIKMQGAYREELSGSIAVKQDPEAGELVKPGTVVEVDFRHMDTYD
ncbi:MAG: PASTA domain-containing protein [Clostridia bacterium]|nr:PASTA domain-containing protein [Clostridia bacterium]